MDESDNIEFGLWKGIIGDNKEFAYREWLIGKALESLINKKGTQTPNEIVMEAFGFADLVIERLAKERLKLRWPDKYP